MIFQPKSQLKKPSKLDKTLKICYDCLVHCKMIAVFQTEESPNTPAYIMWSRVAGNTRPEQSARCEQ